MSILKKIVGVILGKKITILEMELLRTELEEIDMINTDKQKYFQLKYYFVKRKMDLKKDIKKAKIKWFSSNLFICLELMALGHLIVGNTGIYIILQFIILTILLLAIITLIRIK